MPLLTWTALAAGLLAAPAAAQTRSAPSAGAPAVLGLAPALPGFSSLAPLSSPFLGSAGLAPLQGALPVLQLAPKLQASGLQVAPPLRAASSPPAQPPAAQASALNVRPALPPEPRRRREPAAPAGAGLLPRSLGRAQAARTFGSWSAELSSWFDGGREKSGVSRGPASAPSPLPAGRLARARRQLKELAAPWRTQRNLERLERLPRGPRESFEFALVGDAEPGRFWFSRTLFNRPGVFLGLLRRIAKTPVDFVLQLGDMVSRGTAANYTRLFRDLARVRLPWPFLTVIGNHDRRRPHGVSDSALYRAFFGPTDYFFDRGGVRFVVLDSSARRLLPQQLEWLDRALDTDKLKLVFTHMPPDPLRGWVDYGRLRGAGGLRIGAEEFTRLVARRGVARVYVGHVHAFGAAEHLGVRYVLSGGGGSALFPSGIPKRDRFHHYIVVRVGPDGVRETVHKADGTSFSL